MTRWFKYLGVGYPFRVGKLVRVGERLALVRNVDIEMTNGVVVAFVGLLFFDEPKETMQ